MRGLSVNILRSGLGDCTNKGVTSPALSKGRIVVVFDEAIDHGNWDLEECRDDPRFLCLKIVRRWVGTPNEYLHVEPLHGETNMAGPMMGGNYVTTSDSRFRDIARYPLPVHDRRE
jgi:hypothetical protein